MSEPRLGIPNPRQPFPNLTVEEFLATPPSIRALGYMADFTNVYRVEEDPRGSNRGRWVDWFNANAGAARGSYWCASACWTAAKLGGLRLKVQYPASVASWYDFGHLFRILTKQPKRGRPVLFIRPTGNHMGWCAEDLAATRGAGWYRGYEGNTNNDGSRNGYGMFEKFHEVDEHTWFMDLDQFDSELLKRVAK